MAKKSIFIIISALIALVLFGKAYRTDPAPLYILWLVLLPIIFSLSTTKVANTINKSVAEFVFAVIIGYSVLISILFFSAGVNVSPERTTLFSYGRTLDRAITMGYVLSSGIAATRDYVGIRLVEGYSVTYTGECCTHAGGPYLATHIKTERWYARIFLWLFDWLCALLAVGINIFVIVMANRMKKRSLAKYIHSQRTQHG